MIFGVALLRIQESMCRLLALGLSFISLASVAAPVETPEFIRLTNRSKCALESHLPTTSALLVYDSFNSGKLGHNLGYQLQQGGLQYEDPAALAEEAMREFRLANTKLLNFIFIKLVRGELPLLQASQPDSVSPSELHRYSSIIKACANQPYCEDLRLYLKDIWQVGMTDFSTVDQRVHELQKIDSFGQTHLAKNLVTKPSCAYLKKFSPLQAQLHHSEVSSPMLEELARAYIDKETYLASCFSEDSSINNRYGALQFDLSVKNARDWESLGFDYWHSVKVYWSWAWREAPELQIWAPRFHRLFRSLSLEESVLLIPNGCQSISPPQCDSETLAVNSIRELAKSQRSFTEHSRQYPQSPQNLLLERGVRSVNDDFLGTRAFETASDWVKNFREHYVAHRGHIKLRFQSAVQLIQMISESISASELAQMNQLLTKSNVTNSMRDQFYYLCTEVRLAGDKRLDFMRSDIDRLVELRNVLALDRVNGSKISSILSYFNSYIEGVLPLCDQLERESFWTVSDYTTEKSGFNQWAKEILQIPQTRAEDTQLISSPIFDQPLLVWSHKLEFDPLGSVICASSLDCGRKVVKALVDLHSAAVYADAFLPVTSEALSPSLFNPYSELTACKIYDPWYQTKRVQKRLLADLANSALFGFTALPIFIDTNWSYPKVTSYNQLVEQGVVKFAPNINKSKMQSALVADFGPLLGAPCSVAIAPTPMLGVRYYAFSGISINYCDSKQSTVAESKRPNEIHVPPSATRSFCGGCALNFVSVSSSASGILESTPLKGFIYLFRTLYNFTVGMRDTVNIPIETKINLNYLKDTYIENDFRIPEYCLKPLGQGLRCFQSVCAARVADYFEQLTGKRAKAVHLSSGQESNYGQSNSNLAWVTTDYCQGEIAIHTVCDERTHYFYAAPKKRWGIKSACRGKI